jgi:cysteine desulfurase
MKQCIYLDYAATTPVDQRVAEKIHQYLTMDGVFGNPASSHAFGLSAKAAIDQARHHVANLIGADASEIIWTSGATEANNLALKGAAELYRQKGKHIITMKTEHPSVLDSCQYLEKQGYLITYLAPNRNGLLDLATLRDALRDDTILVSIMHVNNETGVIQDIASIGAITAERGILFHVDAAQSAGKIAIDVNAMHVDLMSFSAHKVYGPKGIGALYVRKKPRIKVASQIHGGGQESGMRSGTLATHQIVGMGEAFAIAKQELTQEAKKLKTFRELFLQKINKISQVVESENCVPGILNICIAGIKSQTLMQALPEVAISAGSACHAKGTEPSYVLRALGMSHEQASCCVRISFGRFTTQAEVERAAELINNVI